MARANYHFGSQILITDSQWVSAVWYDPTACVLEVDTKTGQRYRYYDVDHTAWAHFSVAKSMGTHFNAAIKGKYRRRKLTTKA